MESTPLISGYKLEFVTRRLAQTLCGGLHVGCRNVSLAFHSTQAVLFVWPLVLGGTLTIFVEGKLLEPYLALGMAGAFGAVAVVAVEATVLVLRRKSIEAFEDPSKSHVVTSADDDQRPPLTTKGAVVRFLFPAAKPITLVFVCALVSGLATLGLLDVALPSQLSTHWHIPLLGHVLCLLCWVSGCTVLWSLVVSPPPETATYVPNPKRVSATLFRPFYLLLLIAVARTARSTVSSDTWWMAAIERNVVLCIASLPLLFLLGVLPPIEALLYWLPEWTNTHLVGGSPSPDVVRTYTLLFLSMGAVLLCLPSYHLWATLCACFCGFVLSLDLVPVYRWLCTGPCLKCKKINWNLLLGYAGLLASSMALAALPHLWHSNLIERWINSPFLISLLIMCAVSVEAPYAMFGFFRNPFYPEVAEVDALKTFRRRFGYLITLRKLLLKMVSPLVMVTFLSKLATRTSNTHIIMSAMAHVTCFRVVWQRTEAALLDLCVFWIVQRWTTLLEAFSLDPLPAVWLVEILRQWVVGVGARCHLVAVLMVTSMSQAKQRLRLSWLLPAVNVLFLPLLLVLIMISAFLQTSLLPLFSLPLFLPSFPRPSKFWPGIVGQSASSCHDSVYYEQMAPYLTKALRDSIANATMGSLEAGTLLLARLEERLLWIQVLESGYGFHTLSIKGLELQETSCHAVEAQKVDELFEAVFSDSRTNPEPFHSLLPVDFVPVMTYSSVKGVLTGVIDSHEFSDVLGNLFDRALVWLLLQFKLADLIENGPPRSAESPTENSDDPNSVCDSRIPETWADAVHSLKSIGSADWSDSDDPLEQSPRGEPEGCSTNTTETGERIRDIELQVPTQNVWSSSAPVVKMARWVDEKLVLTVPSMAPCDSTLCLPEMWLRVRDNIETFAACNMVAFSESWFWKVLERKLENAPRTVQALCENSRTDHKLLQQYRDMVAFCHVATMSPDDKPSPGTICSAFCGRLHSSGSKEHPIDVASLQDIATCAFRYSVKLALDAVLIGSADNDGQLMEALEDLDSDWFIGMEGSSSWSEAVLKETPQLFCIFHDTEQDVYRSHLLTLREVSVPVGRLHSETVRSLWSTLSLELLYLTNDDDERYSIQAHPTILRNLTIQAANPPLGYPIFSSSPVTIPTLW